MKSEMKLKCWNYLGRRVKNRIVKSNQIENYFSIILSFTLLIYSKKILSLALPPNTIRSRPCPAGLA